MHATCLGTIWTWPYATGVLSVPISPLFRLTMGMDCLLIVQKWTNELTPSPHISSVDSISRRRLPILVARMLVWLYMTISLTTGIIIRYRGLDLHIIDLRSLLTQEVLLFMWQVLPVHNVASFTCALCGKHQDDDTNYHMDLIAGLSNMRARNYRIQEVDKLKAKFIAGRIIPAIATTTAMATGFVCLELYKVLNGGHKVEDYRNTFVNLALTLFSMAEPVPPKVIKHQDLSWTVWDRWILRDNPTLRELLKWLENKGLKVNSISFDKWLLYMFPGHKDRMDEKMVHLATEVAKDDLPPYRRHFDVVVDCEDEDEDDDEKDVDIPRVSIYFR